MLYFSGGLYEGLHCMVYRASMHIGASHKARGCNLMQGRIQGGGGVMGVATPPNDFKKPRPPWSELSSFFHWTMKR